MISMKIWCTNLWNLAYWELSNTSKTLIYHVMSGKIAILHIFFFPHKDLQILTPDYKRFGWRGYTEYNRVSRTTNVQIFFVDLIVKNGCAYMPSIINYLDKQRKNVVMTTELEHLRPDAISNFLQQQCAKEMYWAVGSSVDNIAKDFDT